MVTEADRERWELAGKIAEKLWEENAPGVQLDNARWWFTVRSIYRSDIPTRLPGEEGSIEEIEAGSRSG